MAQRRNGWSLVAVFRWKLLLSIVVVGTVNGTTSLLRRDCVSPDHRDTSAWLPIFLVAAADFWNVRGVAGGRSLNLPQCFAYYHSMWDELVLLFVTP